MVVDSENNGLYHQHLRREIKEISENKGTSPPTFNPFLSVDFVSFHCCCIAAVLFFWLGPAEMNWAESHTNQTGVGVSELGALVLANDK